MTYHDTKTEGRAAAGRKNAEKMKTRLAAGVTIETIRAFYLFVISCGCADPTVE